MDYQNLIPFLVLLLDANRGTDQSYKAKNPQLNPL